MLSKPEYGWSNITIGDWTDRYSDVSIDEPADFLDTICMVINNRRPHTIFCDAEGYEYYIIFNTNETVIVSNKENEEANEYYNTKTFFIPIEKIAKELISDIRDNIDEWSEWGVWEFDSDDTERAIAHNKILLNILCDNTETAIKEYLEETKR